MRSARVLPGGPTTSQVLETTYSVELEGDGVTSLDRGSGASLSADVAAEIVGLEVNDGRVAVGVLADCVVAKSVVMSSFVFFVSRSTCRHAENSEQKRRIDSLFCQVLYWVLPTLSCWKM